MCLSCQASPAGYNDALLGYLSSESSAWDWRPEKHNKDMMTVRDVTLVKGYTKKAKKVETRNKERRMMILYYVQPPDYNYALLNLFV